MTTRVLTPAGGYALPTGVYEAQWLERMKRRTVITASGCWEWQGGCSRFRNQKPGQRGYAQSNFRGRTIRIHRKTLELKLGHSLPRGIQACHTCDNPPCINPAHLYAATNQQNHLDGGKRKRMQGQTKTHCKHGHEYTPENTYWSPRKTVNGVVGRIRNCRECNRIRLRREWQENSEQRRARQRAWRAKRRQIKQQQLNGDGGRG